MLKKSIQTPIKKIILGIDPGTSIIGFGLVEKRAGSLFPLTYGCFKNPANEPIEKKLLKLANELEELLTKHKPEILAIEKIFFFKNSKTIVDVSRAQGVILLAAAKFKIPIFEFTPLEIKQAVSGYGRAEKQQIQKMVRLILKLNEIPKPDDAADALAIAICAANSVR